jgi:hypothetical protein
MTKCYGEACPMSFMCRQKTKVAEWMVSCELIEKSFKEKLAQIPEDMDVLKKITLRTNIIIQTFEEFCDALEHPHKDEIMENLRLYIFDPHKVIQTSRDENKIVSSKVKGLICVNVSVSLVKTTSLLDIFYPQMPF